MILRALELGVSWLDTAADGAAFDCERLIGAAPFRSPRAEQLHACHGQLLRPCAVMPPRVS